MEQQYNTQLLIERLEKGDNIKYLLFWGHRKHKTGEITSTCFSQWWEQDFEKDEIIYPTAEHWMMAEKARLFDDKEILEKILLAKTPSEAKKLGRLINNFDNKLWEAKRDEIVILGNYYKFKQNKDILDYLLKSNERVIVEASPVDEIWGIGLDRDSENAKNPEKWRGLNLLGFALMKVREIIKSEP